MSWFNDDRADRIRDGMDDEKKGNSDPIREFFEPDYKRGVDISKGTKGGRRAREDLSSIDGIVVDGVLGGFDTMGMSKDEAEAYERVKHGESPRKVSDEALKYNEENEDYYEEPSFGYIGRASSDNEWDSIDYSPGESINLPFSNILIGLLVLGGLVAFNFRDSIYKSFKSEIQFQQKVKIAKEYNLPKNNLVERVKWGVQKSSSKSKKSKKFYDGSYALRNFETYNLNPGPKVKKSLENLAKLISKDVGQGIIINDYSQVNENLWASGSYSYRDKGFICYSPDSGETWFKQWISKPLNAPISTGEYDSPFGIHFFDEKEGWAFTINRMLHTLDSGRTWNNVYSSPNLHLRQIHLIDRKQMIVEDMNPTTMRTLILYTLDGGESWETYSEVGFGKLEFGVKLKSFWGKKLFVYDGAR